MTRAGDLSESVCEPVAVTAGLARRWASHHCAPDPTGISCDCYHGLWQYLRLMNLGKTLGGHAREYLEAMAHLSLQWDGQAVPAPRRILISGCADYSMLAHVLHVFKRSRSQVLVTVLDRCPTPLKLNHWFAKETGAPVELVCSDVLRHQPADAYDLVITSGFLGYFDPQTRPRLFEVYSRMLRPGGRLVFSNRLRPAAESCAVGFTHAQADTVARKVAQSSHRLPSPAALPQADAYKLAYAYAANLHSFPVNSSDTIQALAAHAGLRWISASRATPAALQQGISGPTVGDGSDYLFVILEK